jgi:diguanylate cyclase
MAVARAVRAASAGDSTRHLYERIGDFLFDQRLEPDPANFTFAYHLLADPDGPLARAVHALTDGGVRLTQRDIETLGVDAKPNHEINVKERAEGLVARTQMQVEGFADMVTAMRAETADFGRNLAASAQAISRSAEIKEDASLALDEVAQITATMLARVRDAEEQLESATREASDLREKLEEARDNARRDPLTQLPNRRAFEEAFANKSLTRAKMCIAVCDVDHFKSVNDRFGHAVGDRVLKAIAEALSQSCVGHLVTRYGGEEFAILFSGTTLERARETLETARIFVQAKRYKLRDSDEPLGEITFSAGLTPVADGEMHQGAFHRADRLLYEAKSAGRNCVHIGAAPVRATRR